jgi:hypothetical protein
LQQARGNDFVLDVTGPKSGSPQAQLDQAGANPQLQGTMNPSCRCIREPLVPWCVCVCVGEGGGAEEGGRGGGKGRCVARDLQLQLKRQSGGGGGEECETLARDTMVCGTGGQTNILGPGASASSSILSAGQRPRSSTPRHQAARLKQEGRMQGNMKRRD